MRPVAQGYTACWGRGQAQTRLIDSVLRPLGSLVDDLPQCWVSVSFGPRGAAETGGNCRA